jgi:hypothetical protein
LEKAKADAKENGVKWKGDRDSRVSTPSEYKIAAKLFIVMHLAYRGNFGAGVKRGYIRGEIFEFSKDELRAHSYIIRNMKIHCEDFEEFIQRGKATPTTLEFYDKPYLDDPEEKAKKTKTKVKTAKDLCYLPPFEEEDVERLSQCLKTRKSPSILTHYPVKFVDILCRDAGYTPRFAYRNGKGEIEIIYIKNIEFDVNDVKAKLSSTVIYLEEHTTFLKMQAHIKEYYTALDIKKAEAEAKKAIPQTDPASEGGGDND